MQDHLASLLLALGIFSAGFVSVGPNILSVIGTSMENGRAAGCRLALGIGIGAGVWASLTVAGLTALVASYAHAITLLKFVGAAYLLWLAFRAFRSAASAGTDLTTSVASGHNLTLKGFSIQMTNPKAALHWVAIVGIGLGGDAPLWSGLTLIFLCTVLSIFGHMAYALTFSTQTVVRFYRRGQRWISAALGLFFSFAAFKLATFRP